MAAVEVDEVKASGCFVPQELIQTLKISKVLGKGAYATVYSASFQGRQVALKVLHPQYCNRDDIHLKSFFREGVLLHEHHHDCIIRCEGLCQLPPSYPGLHGHQGNSWAMILEYVQAGTLHSQLTAQLLNPGKRTYSDLQGVRWMLQTALALQYLHTLEPLVVHRDIKLQNILLAGGSSSSRTPSGPAPDGATHAAGPASTTAAPPTTSNAPAATTAGSSSKPQLQAKVADFGLHVKLDDQREMLLRLKSPLPPPSVATGPASSTNGPVSGLGPLSPGSGMTSPLAVAVSPRDLFLKVDEGAGVARSGNSVISLSALSFSGSVHNRLRNIRSPSSLAGSRRERESSSGMMRESLLREAMMAREPPSMVRKSTRLSCASRAADSAHLVRNSTDTAGGCSSGLLEEDEAGAEVDKALAAELHAAAEAEAGRGAAGASHRSYSRTTSAASFRCQQYRHSEDAANPKATGDAVGPAAAASVPDKPAPDSSAAAEDPTAAGLGFRKALPAGPGSTRPSSRDPGSVRRAPARGASITWAAGVVDSDAAWRPRNDDTAHGLAPVRGMGNKGKSLLQVSSGRGQLVGSEGDGEAGDELSPLYPSSSPLEQECEPQQHQHQQPARSPRKWQSWANRTPDRPASPTSPARSIGADGNAAPADAADAAATGSHSRTQLQQARAEAATQLLKPEQDASSSALHPSLQHSHHSQGSGSNHHLHHHQPCSQASSANSLVRSASQALLHGDCSAGGQLAVLDRMRSVFTFMQAVASPAVEAEVMAVFSLTGATGSCLYMSPEVFRHQPYNEKVDVFSLGVCMYEVFGRTLVSLKLGVYFKDAMEYAMEVSCGYRPERTTCIPDRLWDLINKCWQEEPSERPSAEDVVCELQQVMEAMERLGPHRGTFAALAGSDAAGGGAGDWEVGGGKAGCGCSCVIS